MPDAEIEGKALSILDRALLSCRLLNTRHFAEDEAWGVRSQLLGASGLRAVLEMQTDQAMLRIEKDCDGRVAKPRLSGRMESNLIASLQSAMNDCCARKILDLKCVFLIAYLRRIRSGSTGSARSSLRSSGQASRQFALPAQTLYPYWVSTCQLQRRMALRT